MERQRNVQVIVFQEGAATSPVCHPSVSETKASVESFQPLIMDSPVSAFVSKRPHPLAATDASGVAGQIENIRPGWFWISGLSGFCIALYCTSVFYGWRAAWKKSKELNLEQDADVSNRYDGIASRFDNDIDFMEKAMFLDKKRQKMCDKAQGHVLEVSVGTGRNGRFYDLKNFGGNEMSSSRKLKGNKMRIQSLTFVDQSSKMMEICSQKWKDQHPTLKGRVSFAVADAGAPGAISSLSPDGGFDTILQTFGLCSMAEPVEYMKAVRDLLKKQGEKGSQPGRILLLEHGRGHYWWINYILDGLAKEHADRFGCWWNRDIGKIVTDSGLRITSLKRYHLGTTWALELEEARTEGISTSENKKTM